MILHNRHRLVCNRRRLYRALRFAFDAAQPIATDKKDKAADGGKPQIDRAQRDNEPPLPQADQVTNTKADDAQGKANDQTPKASVADEVIECAIERRNDEGEEERWEGHESGYTSRQGNT